MPLENLWQFLIIKYILTITHSNPTSQNVSNRSENKYSRKNMNSTVPRGFIHIRQYCKQLKYPSSDE